MVACVDVSRTVFRDRSNMYKMSMRHREIQYVKQVLRIKICEYVIMLPVLIGISITILVSFNAEIFFNGCLTFIFI